MNHAPKLDALRGMAAIVVLAAHAGQIFLWRLMGEHSTFAVLSGNAARHAVLVFFLLSGYLITGSILANVRRHGHFSAADYLAARATRIYPPLLGAIVVVLLAGAIIHGFNLPGASFYGPDAVRQAYSVSLNEVLKALLMQDGLLKVNGPLWTLYVEVHLYLVAMLVALAWTQRSAIWTASAAVLLAFYLQQAQEFALFAGVWGLGAVAAVTPAQMRGLRVLGASAAVGLLALAVLAPRELDFQNGTFGAPLQLAFALVYLWAFILSPRFWSRPPTWAVGSAAFSYTLYVIHFPMLLLSLSLAHGWLGRSMTRSGIAAALAAAACVVAAFYAAKLLEDQRRFKPAIQRALGASQPVRRAARTLAS